MKHKLGHWVWVLDTGRAGLPEGHPDLNAFLGLPILVNAELIAVVGLANPYGTYPIKFRLLRVRSSQ
ncbi:MAG: hypothetical protein ACJAW7_003404 [Candidatus Azotimanducaceae bacterium]|jgi:hypothetical protein